MSENPTDGQGEKTAGIDDDQLPEDLRPSEDNPLAEPLDEDEVEGDLDVLGGKTPDESSDESEDGASDDDS